MKRLLLILGFLSIVLSMDITSGGKLSKNQLAVDVRHYDIRLKVDPKRKMISGHVDIKIKIIDEVRFIELDLLNQYFISKIMINGVTTPFKHRDNTIFITVSYTHLTLPTIYSV